MADLPEPMEIELDIAGRREKLKYRLTPGKGGTPDYVMLIPEDEAQHERLSPMELEKTLKEEVARTIRLENPVVAVGKPKNK